MASLSKNGNITQEELARVKRVLFALAYGDPKLVETMGRAATITRKILPPR